MRDSAVLKKQSNHMFSTIVLFCVMLRDVLQSQEFQNQLEKKKLEIYNVEADFAAKQAKICELIKQLKQNEKEKLDLGEKLKDCEVTTVVFDLKFF